MNENLARLIADAERRLTRLEVAERPQVLRGWRDDFFGDSLHGQYSTATLGGSVALVDLAHGGIVRMAANAGNGNYGRMALASNYHTLDVDEGWSCQSRFSISALTNAALVCGVRDTANSNFLDCGLDTSAGHSNWLIRTRIGGGAVNYTNTGIPADTDMHAHRLDAYPISGGNQVDYFLDGELIASITVNIPTAVLYAHWTCYNLGAAARSLDLDYCVVIPKNLG